MKLEDYATAKEAAKELGLKYKTLLSQIKKGQVQAQLLGGKVFLISREHIAELKKLNSAGARS